MARSDVNHFNTLNSWPRLMEEDEWRWNQIMGKGVRNSNGAVYIQYERDMIANGLNQAGEELAQALGFYPRPTWLQERIHYGDKWMAWQELRTRYAYIEAFGIRTTSLIQAGVTVTYSDPNADGVNELATISVTTAVATGEIELYFRVADGAPSAGHIDWQIEPIKSISASGGVVTITAPRYLFVNPNRIWANPYVDPNYTEKKHGDTESVQDFVSTVDVYRVYADATAAVQITGDPIFTRCTDLDTAITANGEALLLDSKLGTFRTRLTCTACFESYPESVYVSYKAGYPLDVNGRMDRRLETAMVRLSNTYMPYQPNTFHDRTMNIWKSDLTELDPATLAQADLTPFGGVYQGRIEAWRRVKHLYLGSGSAM